MSTTTTQAPTYSIRATLADYELHNSVPPSESAANDSSNNDVTEQTAGTLRGWSSDHRRVPPYRPVNYNLDLNERLVYQNGIERAFINTMFFGLRVVTVGWPTTQCPSFPETAYDFCFTSTGISSYMAHDRRTF